MTVLLIFWIIHSIRCNCFNCSLLFLHWKVAFGVSQGSEASEGEKGGLIVTHWVDKQKAIFLSSPWTRAQWPRQRWTHPGSVLCLCCSSLKKRAAYKEAARSHYIMSMELQSLNDSFLTLLSVLYYRDVIKDVLYCAFITTVLGHHAAVTCILETIFSCFNYFVCAVVLALGHPKGPGPPLWKSLIDEKVTLFLSVLLVLSYSREINVA